MLAPSRGCVVCIHATHCLPPHCVLDRLVRAHQGPALVFPEANLFRNLVVARMSGAGTSFLQVSTAAGYMPPDAALGLVAAHCDRRSARVVLDDA